MKYRELWKLCVDCIDAFDVLPPHSLITVDDHINNTLRDYFDLEPDEIVFVEEAVRGLFRYRQLAQGALAAYCDGLKRNKEDGTSLTLLAYLLVYRYDELGPVALRSLVYRSTSNSRIGEFVRFLVTREQLDRYCVPRWRAYYDDEYVENMIVQSLLKNKPSLDKHFIRWFDEKASGVHKGDDASLDENSPQTLTQGEKPKRRLIASSPKLSVSKRKKVQLPPAEIRELQETKPFEKFPAVKDQCTPWEVACVKGAKEGLRLFDAQPRSTQAKPWTARLPSHSTLFRPRIARQTSQCCWTR